MGRRFASFAMRRQVRDHGGRGGNPLGPLTNRLALHLQSDFGVTAISGKVSEWAGQEGYRNTVVQAVDANRPTLVPNVLDGHPAIRFAGSHWLESLAQVGVVAGDFPRVYVVASYATALASFASVLLNYDNGVASNRGFSLGHFSNFQNWLALRGGAARFTQPVTAAGNNSIPVLFDGRNQAGSITLAINGVDLLAGTGAPGGLDLTPDAIRVGQQIDGSQRLTGDIFCVICVNNETPTSHATIMNYLAGQYPSLGLGTPKGILGPLLHADFDAADPGIVLNAGNVASIPNRGTDTAAMVQATAANQPVYSATSFAGGPGMTFDGVNDTLMCTFATPIPTGRRPYMWLVFQNTSLLSYQVGASVHSAGGAAIGSTLIWSHRDDTVFIAGHIDPGGGPVSTTPSAITSDTVKTHLVESGFTISGVAACVVDGVPTNAVAPAASVPTTKPLTAVRAGAYADTPSFFATSTIRRVIVANDLPSQAQIDAMRAYLRAQPYGLTF